MDNQKCLIFSETFHMQFTGLCLLKNIPSEVCVSANEDKLAGPSMITLMLTKRTHGRQLAALISAEGKTARPIKSRNISISTPVCQLRCSSSWKYANQVSLSVAVNEASDGRRCSESRTRSKGSPAACLQTCKLHSCCRLTYNHDGVNTLLHVNVAPTFKTP